MNYPETLSWLYSQLPMYQRIGAAAYKDNLNNTIALCDLLGNPQNYFDSVHVAGTNGKGSVSHMLASICQEHGLKTGLYTSPHLKDFRERIRVNGLMIPKRRVTGFINKYKEEFEQIKPSFFEMTVGMAFDYFRNEEVDIAIVEVGMGGRLDSTNILTPLVSVITNISFDHQPYLGDTLKKIAIEKAGIIKPGIPVVIGETQSETGKVFRKKAGEYGSPIIFADRRAMIHLTPGPSPQGEGSKSPLGLPRELAGDLGAAGIRHPASDIQDSLQTGYQQKNIQTALTVVSLLRDMGFGIRDNNIRSGISNVATNTGLQGRWQVIGHDPLTICDAGHNEAGIREVVAQVKKTPHENLHIVFGMVNDKEVDHILKLLPKEATYYFCKANIPRALNADELMDQAKSVGLTGTSFGSVKKALNAARKAAQPQDLIFIGGSTFVVAEVVP